MKILKKQEVSRSMQAMLINEIINQVVKPGVGFSSHMVLVLSIIILLSPLMGALIAGLLSKKIGRSGAHWVTILLVAISFLLSCEMFYQFIFNHAKDLNTNLYQWAQVQHLAFNIGFLIDKLTVFMMVIVTFVSLMVHIYSIGYMKDDPGYQRFFSYISGFTFAMLALVMANNFMLLFFGWEGVGLVSYLLIGFWFKKDSANYAAIKAFLANRVGDLGFLLGLAGILLYFGTLDYAQVFSLVPNFASTHPNLNILGHVHWQVMTVICLLLFAGAAGKSAQIPLHIWLEGSMEGPTPISALIHAATMVTAGVFMMARLSPMFEYSDMALSTVMILGAATAFFMGVLGVVQHDIKRVIAYSTLSQLGYMMAAAGASAYSLGLFHLMTHAAFKALLFLSAGSVIVAMHHEQDIRKMGRLGRKMPVTYICMLIGALALSAVPPFSGFYSKDLIIEAVGTSVLPGSNFAYWMVLAGAFVTSLYTFRMFFLVFHGKSRVVEDPNHPIHESPLSILIPLILLAVPAVFAGYVFFKPVFNQFFGTAIFVLSAHNVTGEVFNKLTQEDLTQAGIFALHSIHTLPFYLSILGILVSWICYVLVPSVPEKLSRVFNYLYLFLIKKYFIDDAYDLIFGAGVRALAKIFWQVGDRVLLDQGVFHGAAGVIQKVSTVLRKMQSGYLFHYVLIMILGVFVLLGWAFIKGL